MNQLESLRKYTTVVADTGSFESIKNLKPTDATTNPSLILKAAQQKEYNHLLTNIIKNNKNISLSDITDKITVEFGKEILKIIPGRVSTEVDARLSFDTKATIEKARFLINQYESSGIDRKRVLIKIAATWEGIQAAKTLEMEGIHCNLTLLFSLTQAMACAQANVKLISPFVGRIYDWHKKNEGAEWNEENKKGENDPGVKSVVAIYNYYKSLGIETEIMGASFRNINQIISLSGCDLLTISPELLKELEKTPGHTPAKLNKKYNEKKELKKHYITESEFRFMLNSDVMASEKLAEGIRAFIKDTNTLENIIKEHI
ncbi:transaldolase [Candidatus Kinetoplastibacterium desouzaii TCC079E]|uniref:Transaldolase n=1 Tax=Candidatus Kinetoplastidibacterium desouzai TCC079E TaxID=1208919 RepID=M1LRB2_9PROT|nr:transaldolase [Candidatus Kinetoplastibacterium desouzaii]AGF46696.1 transaldolase [Candidatus Kinetoplastibacterium desouzaii TCC079E]